MKRKLFLIVFCVLLAFAAQAHADLFIYPTSASYVLGTNYWNGEETSNDDISDIVDGITGNLPELYKKNNDGTEDFTLAGSYATTFSSNATPSDPNDLNNAIITYTGGNIVGPEAYLLVKDGSANPSWYLFDLTDIFGWNGMETLQVLNFWNGPGGSISHVSLYGNSQPVPEPVSMLLFGTGLVGVGEYIRRRFKKN